MEQARKYVCKKCNKDYTLNKTLLRHMRSSKCASSTLKTWTCSSCKKQFNTELIFKQHKKICNKYVCDGCGKHFVSKSVLSKHFKFTKCGGEHISKCKNCGKQFYSIHTLQRHVKACKGQRPHRNHAARSQQIIVSSNPTYRCDPCNIDVEKKNKSSHIRSEAHKNKIAETYCEHVSKINDVFGGRIGIFKISNPDPSNLDYSTMFGSSHMRDMIRKLLDQYLNDYTNIKFKIITCGNYAKNTTDDDKEPVMVYSMKHFESKFADLTKTSDLDHIFDELFADLVVRSDDFQLKDSGWSLQEILHLELQICKQEIVAGSSYVPLPDFIQNKKACINPKNMDEYCFKWVVRMYFYNMELNNKFETEVDHIKNSNEHELVKTVKINCINAKIYKKLVELDEDMGQEIDQKYNLNYDGVSFPMEINKITDFLLLNPHISITVFGVEENEKKSVVGPLFKSKEKQQHHIYILYFENEGVHHYCWIKNLPRLVNTTHIVKRNRKHICDTCLQFFNSSEKLEQHIKNQCFGMVTVLPEPGTTIKFENYYKKIKMPFVVYADFESVLKPVHGCSNDLKNKSCTTSKHLHVPSSYCFLIKCSFDSSLDELVLYRGEDCVENFVDTLLEKLQKKYEDHVLNRYVPKRLASPEKLAFKKATVCHICESTITTTQKKVADHCHLTGMYRGAAHDECNKLYYSRHEVSVFFHNFQFYDSHLFIKALVKKQANRNVSIIPSTDENYISVSKSIEMNRKNPAVGNNKHVYLNVRFKDSLKFLSGSIDALSKNLKPDDFKNLKQYFGNMAPSMMRKGVFPYEAVTSFASYNMPKLPKRQFFATCTNNYQQISDKDYKFAKTIFNDFNCKSLGEYSDIYLKSDVCILSDIFETFRNECLSPDLYNLDPIAYYTLPGFSWDAMLKLTKVEIELMSDPEMLDFILKGIRGGLV